MEFELKAVREIIPSNQEVKGSMKTQIEPCHDQ